MSITVKREKTILQCGYLERTIIVCNYDSGCILIFRALTFFWTLLPSWRHSAFCKDERFQSPLSVSTSSLNTDCLAFVLWENWPSKIGRLLCHHNFFSCVVCTFPSYLSFTSQHFYRYLLWMLCYKPLNLCLEMYIHSYTLC